MAMHNNSLAGSFTQKLLSAAVALQMGFAVRSSFLGLTSTTVCVHSLHDFLYTEGDKMDGMAT